MSALPGSDFLDNDEIHKFKLKNNLRPQCEMRTITIPVLCSYIVYHYGNETL
jgi:hypothetical protein